mmetsp:Transcript_17104/g.33493  ORF Transcript_17104/g.33493 Transcript_17104/m.33493 type:complete len:300 (-) Transcript_17104:131-1030(-)|eukprot:CAMPEP_0171498650 /NCGR_PEP_ID=MMETSP0958-20121227/7973_1 /TAXON_ID=87120 /ORGANISM="Aurantiochytrium limacinum, Strain ATCCMYA-1381" /LENGTH=299 /DNA_ID=CAMNT_0012033083 /DNA_START=73 /DNA_END=972 /DNA_ORIENTATION=+
MTSAEEPAAKKAKIEEQAEEVKEVAETTAEMSDKVEEAVKKAEEAAEKAQETAEKAEETVEKALGKAEEAVENAMEVCEKAEEAVENAEKTAAESDEPAEKAEEPAKPADEDAPEEPVPTESPVKAQWKLDDHKMNISHVVDKESAEKNLHDVIEDKPSVLSGLGEVADEILAAVHIKTVKDLANWKFGKIARAILVLAELEEEGKRPEGSNLNIDNALDAEFEQKSFKDMVDLPVSALQGLPERVNDILKRHHIDTIGKLGKWKYLREAEALVTLAAFEETKSPAARRAAREAKKLEA